MAADTPSPVNVVHGAINTLDHHYEEGNRLSENAIRVLERRYLKKDRQGNIIETPEQMFHRVADNIASPERYLKLARRRTTLQTTEITRKVVENGVDPDGDEDIDENAGTELKEIRGRFYRLISSLEFLPNSPTLMNAGNDLQQLSACFVLPVEDSMDSIFEAVKNTALIHKSGGGTGFSFSRIRPKSDVVMTTKGVSSGPLSFMKVFDVATETIKQGGTRRGANMGILKVDHPDIIDFISAKEDGSTLSNFNLSVAITEKFMRAVLNDDEYDLVNPRSGQLMGRKKAREVFDLMVKMAWKNGDPGFIFLDRINRDNPTPGQGEIESTNPCGEQPLLPYESCNLGSINLGRMVSGENSGLAIDYPKLKKTVREAVYFLDDVIDMNCYPLAKIKEVTLASRKIGLGVMGFADMLIMLGIPYDSEKALSVGEEVMKFINDESKVVSAQLARERGPFQCYASSTYAEKGGEPLRNATTTTIAPTGTLSIIANCSSGIEPLFAICYERKVMDNDVLLEVNPLFENTAVKEGFYSKELMERIAAEGSIQDIPGVPDHVKRIFVTSHDISPEWHIRMQAAFQKHTDNAVSKTINFPNHATEGDIHKAFIMAFENGCKGLTIYRDGSRDVQVLNIGTAKAVETTAEKEKLTPRPRPMVTLGRTERKSTGCGNLYVTINEDDRGLFEIFARMGKSGGCIASHSEAIGRLISLALRAGVDPESIIQQLSGIRCPSPAFGKEGSILSCPDAIGWALKNYLSDKNGHETNGKPASKTSGNTILADVCPECPECGNMIEFADGCIICRSCGYSKCG